MGNELLLRLSFFVLCVAFYGNAEEREDKVTLTADAKIIQHAGGRVTLTCSAYRPAALMYELYRRSSFHGRETFINTSNGVFSITEGGIYRCRGFTQGFFTPVSDDVTIKETVSNRVSVTMEPNWSQIYRGEKVTLRCEIRGGGGAQWMYEWRPNRNSPSSREYKINSATASDSGEYSCMAKSDYKQTQWSDAFRLSVLSEKPKATVTADNTIIPAGGSVTLRCSVENSADWKVYWFRRDFSGATNINNNKPDGTIIVSDGGVYSCRGGRRGRGDPVFYTETSREVTIQKTGEFSYQLFFKITSII
uniref:Ig-like domain-containing protein n=1 Tax=Poecilia mexicana TaxID=48701 RepID=A0A3B3XH54_9TELE